MAGIVVFTSAFYSGFALKIAKNLFLIQYCISLILQIVVIFVPNRIFLVLIYITDGVFKGGIRLFFFEITAELAFPIGESISLGLLNCIMNGARVFINFTKDGLVDPTVNHEE